MSKEQRRQDVSFKEKKATLLAPLPLAMAYIPMQTWGEIYSESKGLQRGTLFADLDLPFYGKEVLK